MIAKEDMLVRYRNKLLNSNIGGKNTSTHGLSVGESVGDSVLSAIE